MITISLCMIVRNEEQVLARCLDSVADLMDEVIIVDTGSTDQTKAVARRYTDKIYDYSWNDDFAAARNFSFSKATKDYIYCADADEVLDEVNRRRFLDLKQVLLEEVEIVQMYYCNQLAFNTVYNYDREYRPKLYKRIREFRFIDPIHEMVRLDPVVYDSEIEIQHLPTAYHGSRDIEHFEKMIADHRTVSQRLHTMYAKELFIGGTIDEFSRAMEFFRQSAEDGARSIDEIKEAICILARGARRLEDTETFFQYALRGVACEPPSELCCELGDYYLEKKNYHEAALWYSNAAFETECILNIRYQREYPLKQLISCYQAAGNLEAAEEIQLMLDQEISQDQEAIGSN